MTYEEKVIALLESKELTKEQKEKLESIFPELAESEDEKIRKEIKNLIEEVGEDDSYHVYCFDKMIAWLEKQGEQKQVVIPKFRVGDIIRWKKAGSIEYTIKEICDKGYINTADGIMDISQTDIEFEPVEQKPTWSEEDEENLKWFEKFFRAESVISGGKDIPQDRYLWFKNLKDRVQPQPKQEWSKKDEFMRTRCIGIILGKFYMGEVPTKVEEELNWLKSLRPQSSWKPSDEQMKALDMGICEVYTKQDSERLMSLYKDLKKLREE